MDKKLTNKKEELIKEIRKSAEKFKIHPRGTKEGGAQRESFWARYSCKPEDLEPNILVNLMDHFKTFWWSIFTHPEEF